LLKCVLNKIDQDGFSQDRFYLNQYWLLEGSTKNKDEKSKLKKKGGFSQLYGKSMIYRQFLPSEAERSREEIC